MNIFNTINNEDCIVFMDKFLKNNTIDLIICDPPYFRILKKEQWDKFKTKKDYLKWSLEYLTLCCNKLRYSGTLLLFGCSRNFDILSKLNNILINNGMYFVEEIIIDKGIKSIAGRTSSKIKMLPPVTENILVYRKDAKPFVKNLILQQQKKLNLSSKEIKQKLGFSLKGGGNWTKYCGNTEFPQLPTKEHWNKIKSILNINIDYKKIQETYNPIIGLTNVWTDINFYIKDRQHPSEKPIKLSDRCIKIFSNENNLVFIPFAGSGNEIISCINNKRNFIATEINKEYVNSIILPKLKNIREE